MEGNAAKRRKTKGAHNDDSVAAAGSRLALTRANAVRLRLVAPPPPRHSGDATADDNNSGVQSNVQPAPAGNQANGVSLGLVASAPPRHGGSGTADNNSGVQSNVQPPVPGENAGVEPQAAALDELIPLRRHVPTNPLSSNSALPSMRIPPFRPLQPMAMGIPPFRPLQPMAMGMPSRSPPPAPQVLTVPAPGPRTYILVAREDAIMSYKALVERTVLCNKLTKENARLRQELERAQRRVVELDDQLRREHDAADRAQRRVAELEEQVRREHDAAAGWKTLSAAELSAQPDGGQEGLKCGACRARLAMAVLRLCAVCYDEQRRE